MSGAILVLQAFDPREQRTVALAATRDPSAFRAFRDAVLERARLEILDRDKDDILLLQGRLELERLEVLLELLVPDKEDSRW